MRQRNLNKVFDKVLWGSLMLLPLVMLVIISIHPATSTTVQTSNVDTVTEVVTNSSGFVMDDLWHVLGLSDPESTATFADWSHHSFLYNMFSKLFGYDPDSGYSLLSMSGNGFIPFYATWLVNVNLLHIAVDFILIIPRLCKKFFDKVGFEE